MKFAHFHPEMTLYKRSATLLSVNKWIRDAAINGARFFITLSPLGVLRIVGQKNMTHLKYSHSEKLACESSHLIGIYEHVDNLPDGVWISDVWDDVCDALMRHDLKNKECNG